MDRWSPKDQLGLFSYLKFKFGLWVEVSELPSWVTSAHDGYYEGYIEKHGHRPYDVEKVYTGDNLEYKIHYETVEQGVVEPAFYTRIKR